MTRADAFYELGKLEAATHFFTPRKASDFQLHADWNNYLYGRAVALDLAT